MDRQSTNQWDERWIGWLCLLTMLTVGLLAVAIVQAAVVRGERIAHTVYENVGGAPVCDTPAFNIDGMGLADIADSAFDQGESGWSPKDARIVLGAVRPTAPSSGE